MTDSELNFQDTKIAFADKTDAELREKYRMFKMMNSPALTDLGTTAAQIGLRLGLPIKGLIKSTVFKQFCGGETIEECQPTIDKLGESNIGSILDYSIEGKSEEAVFDSTKNEIYRTVTRAKEDEAIPFAVFKVTGLARVELLEKAGSDKELFVGEQEEWDKARARVEEICEYAHSLEQPLFIDAEESWIQDAIDSLATEMMEKYNQEKPIIYNTIQLYRHDRLDFLKQAHEKARTGGCILAVKLVRGAYMEKERERAAEMGYPSPIQPNKEATDRDFNAALEYCVENIETIALVAGTHNEQSVKYLAQLMREHKIEPSHPRVNFSQLYGMSDNLSYILAKNGYCVSKYVPYGPVKDAI
ncbi:MAG TPA: proline dehydrogenase family protein, partial [Pyrinomonadaceae bacterium]|nr:proline dehydrogenase family protein [Pyrinomonadaceae bacterium]